MKKFMEKRTTYVALPLHGSVQRRRANRIQLLLSDCDGVLTDGGVYYSDQGEVMKRFSIRDGMGVARLRNAGIETGIISGEVSRSVQQRADKLCITHVYLGVKDKLERILTLSNHHKIPLDAIAYIGDDVNDADVMSELYEMSLTAVPGDAIPSVRFFAHYVCRANGGQGAFREFSDWILDLRSAENPTVKQMIQLLNLSEEKV